jgi:putative peptide zinc metalloprotease protein
LSRLELDFAIWPRIAGTRPRLRRHVVFRRHEIRGRLWYVIRDDLSGKVHRLSQEAYLFVSLLDGSISVGEAYEVIKRRLGDDAPKHAQILGLLNQLYAADALRADHTPDIAPLEQRAATLQRRRLWMQLRSPLFLRVPLFDPDRFLRATAVIGRILFSPAAFALWLVVVLFAAAQTATHWQQLTENLAERVLAVENLIVIAVAFPFLKILHELGHGYAVKRWGGAVHDMGLMILVLMPVPYVDASAASAFPSKWRRAVVGAGGMYVEMFAASVALCLWTVLEPGLLKSIAFNVALIGSISTIIFNGNPLLRYDAYYILSDLIEIPNLASRATRYLGFLIKCYWFRLKDLAQPVLADGDAKWLVSYAILSFIYRCIVIAVMALLVAQQFFFIGVALAVWLLITALLWPIIKGVNYMLFAAELYGRRAWALTSMAALAGVLWYLLFFAGIPLTTRLDGIVWVQEEAAVTARTSGFVREILAREGDPVCRGCPILRLELDELQTELEALNARRRALKAKFDAEWVVDRSKAEFTRLELVHIDDRLLERRERVELLVVRSPVDGMVAVPGLSDLTGSFVTRGQLIGYVAEQGALVVRAVVTQGDVGLMRKGVSDVRLVLSDNSWREVSSRMIREIPAATRRLPSAALSTGAGGAMALDPLSKDGDALENVFQVGFSLGSAAEIARFGQRAYLKVHHGHEPIGFQIYRRVRQLFLRSFNV